MHLLDLLITYSLTFLMVEYSALFKFFDLCGIWPNNKEDLLASSDFYQYILMGVMIEVDQSNFGKVVNFQLRKLFELEV